MEYGFKGYKMRGIATELEGRDDESYHWSRERKRLRWRADWSKFQSHGTTLMADFGSRTPHRLCWTFLDCMAVSKSEHDSHWPKIKVWACLHSSCSRGESISLLFSASRGCPHPLAHGPHQVSNMYDNHPWLQDDCFTHSLISMFRRKSENATTLVNSWREDIHMIVPQLREFCKFHNLQCWM